MPGPSNPDGGGTPVSWPPSLAASTLIFSTACCIPPSCVASAWAASLPECISSPCSSWLTVYTPPASTPTLVPSAAASSSVPSTDLLRGNALRDAIATSTLMMLAGRCRRGGSLAAMTAPLSRSATSHASAETSPGGGGVFGAATTPQPPSASPPTGLGGTASGIGGSPAIGTSEESTAGGVDSRYGQFGGPAFGPGLGSANAVGRPSPRLDVGGATLRTAAARHDAERRGALERAMSEQGRRSSGRFAGAA